MRAGTKGSPKRGTVGLTGVVWRVLWLETPCACVAGLQYREDDDRLKPVPREGFVVGHPGWPLVLLKELVTIHCVDSQVPPALECQGVSCGRFLP